MRARALFADNQKSTHFNIFGTVDFGSFRMSSLKCFLWIKQTATAKKNSAQTKTMMTMTAVSASEKNSQTTSFFKLQCICCCQCLRLLMPWCIFILLELCATVRSRSRQLQFEWFKLNTLLLCLTHISELWSVCLSVFSFCFSNSSGVFLILKTFWSVNRLIRDWSQTAKVIAINRTVVAGRRVKLPPLFKYHLSMQTFA